jgi:cobyrinic acid a,c-diamide synthase
VILEVFAAKLNWLPWRRRAGGGRRMASSVGTEELFAFLYATKRNELEQRQAELVMVQTEEDGAPPRMRVDLDAGKVVLPPKTS